MSPAVRTLTIQRLEQLVSDSTKPATMRRAATLRLARLRAASATAKPLTITTRTKAAPAPTEEAKFEAAQSFHALSRQRSALFRNRRRTRGEQNAFNAMVCLMPRAMPQDDDPKAWTNFVAEIAGLLCEIKSIKHL